MRGLISWNGERSDQFGIDVEKYPTVTRPQRKMDKYTIPGRNGDIIMMQDAWENVEQKYDIIAGDGVQGAASSVFSSIASWLCAPKGYCKLWDDFDPGYYRMAYFQGPFDQVALSSGRYARATVSFICKPQKYLIAGSEQVEITGTDTIYNYTVYNARPLIFVERKAATGNGTVTVNGTVFTITGIPADGLYIDCESMNCYDTNNNNVNNIVASSTSEFAKLQPGENAIGFTGKVNKLIITPRFFEI